MIHLLDQDLLLLAHRSLGPIRSIQAKIHLRGCEDCRSRYAAYGALSQAAASMFRVGMPAWKPAGMALRTKILLSVLVLCLGIFAVETAVLPHPPRTPSVPITRPGGKDKWSATCPNPEVGKPGESPAARRAPL